MTRHQIAIEMLINTLERRSIGDQLKNSDEQKMQKLGTVQRKIEKSVKVLAKEKHAIHAKWNGNKESAEYYHIT